jgi:hypothetical protein
MLYNCIYNTGYGDIRWSPLKSQRLKRTRGVSFEEMITAELIDVKVHPKREGQTLLLFKLKGYIWVVPFVEDEKGIFLKTLYPSRRYTKVYRDRRRNRHEKD